MKKTKITLLLAILSFCFYSLSIQAQSSINCRFTPNPENCENYCVFVEISTQDGASYIGSSSIRFSYDSSVLSFAGTSMDGITTGSYQSINFDDDQTTLNSECLIENGGQGGTSYSAHSFDGGTPGDFLATWVLQAPTVFTTYACPSVDSDWVEVAEICFEVLDPIADPNFQFDGTENGPVVDLTGTNFNNDDDPPIKYNNGTFESLDLPFYTVCEGDIEGCTDPLFCNYNEYATIDNGSCSNVDPMTGNTDICLGDIEIWSESICSYEIDVVQVLGCTDPSAMNYNVEANCDDGSCDSFSEAAINCRFTPNPENCENYCVFVEISTQDGASYIGSSSIRFSYDSSVLSFAGNSMDGITTGSYQSINFDDNQTTLNSECLIENGGQGGTPYSAHSFDGGTPGDFLATWVLEAPTTFTTYACPAVDSDWVEVAEICFEVLDPIADPNLEFNGTQYGPITDLAGTNFNNDTSPPIKYNNGAFGELHTPFYTVCEGDIEGCTDPLFCNYNEYATIDNSSCSNTDPMTGNTDICLGDTEIWNESTCSYEVDIVQVLGCMEPLAINYNAAANCDDDSCNLTDGCTDPSFCNFTPAAIIDDGSCNNADPLTGNTNICLGDTEVWNATACTYDIDVVQVLGCTNETAENYNATANCDDDSCIINGCTDVQACNYNFYATVDDGSCSDADPMTGNTTDDICLGDIVVWDANNCAYNVLVEKISGCMDVTACNYNANANCNEGCLYEAECAMCDGFTLIPTALCSDDNMTFTVILLMEYEGAESYTVIDNITGDVISDATNSVSFGPYSSFTGFDFSVFPNNFPNCIKRTSISIISCIVTSVELLDFQGSVEKQGNFLSWRTASEHQSDYFMVERSIDGVHFDLISEVKAIGNSSVVQSYDFVDKKVDVGTYYYRLTEVDQEGKIAVISEVISLRRLSDFDIIKVFPIPTNELVSIEYQTTAKGTINYTVFDITGRIITQQKSSTVEGRNRITLDVSTYVTGTYFIQLNDGNQKTIVRFVKN